MRGASVGSRCEIEPRDDDCVDGVVGVTGSVGIVIAGADPAGTGTSEILGEEAIQVPAAMGTGGPTTEAVAQETGGDPVRVGAEGALADAVMETHPTLCGIDRAHEGAPQLRSTAEP